jgi:single-stranded DNA-binding protein
MNHVQLVGVIVWPVEVWNDRTTGRMFGNAMLAVSADEHPLAFIPVILQDSEAVDAGMYLGEGSRIEVTAHLHSSLLTNHDIGGNKRTRRVLHVIADSVRYLTVRAPQSGDRP